MAKRNITVVFSKHIHSSLSSFSTNDKFAKIVLKKSELDFDLPTKEGGVIVSKKFPMLNGLIIEKVSGDQFCKIICLESDETFYKLDLKSRKKMFDGGYSEEPDFKQHIEEYYIKSGWSIDIEIPEENAYRARVSKRRENSAKKKGLVLWKAYGSLETYRSITPSEYQGGFSDELFNVEEIQNYIKRGVVFGWIGHSVRTPELDKAIEKGLKEKGLSCKSMYNWISSTDGRHFGDSLLGLQLKEQIKKIETYINSIYNLCLIYGSEEHGGTYESTQKIRAKYKSQGILLQEEKV